MTDTHATVRLMHRSVHCTRNIISFALRSLRQNELHNVFTEHIISEVHEPGIPFRRCRLRVICVPESRSAHEAFEVPPLKRRAVGRWRDGWCLAGSGNVLSIPFRAATRPSFFADGPATLVDEADQAAASRNVSRLYVYVLIGYPSRIKEQNS